MVKVALLKYKPRKVWSNVRHGYYTSYNIKDQIWAHYKVPLKVDNIELNEAIEYVKEHPGDSKDTRSALMRFDSDIFPVKEFIGIEKWNGLIFVDLDLDKDPIITKLEESKHKLLYGWMSYALCSIVPNNFMYLEHSSSKIGMHALFYFDCEKTIENYNKYARYVYNIFRYKVDEYIKNFSHIFTNPDCLKENGESKIFDNVYKRPYQKCYITCIDYKLFDVDGKCDDLEIDEEETYSEENEELTTELGKLDIKYDNKSKNKYELHYYDRLYVLTALKKYVKDKNEAYILWYKFCENLKPYTSSGKKNTFKTFVNMFEKEWDKLKPETGHITVLKKYKFKVNDKEINYHLNENQYLSNVIDDIINNAEYGLNMLVAGTGVGKNHSYILLNEKYSQFPEINNHKPILIVEPLNSITESKYDKNKFRIVIGNKKIGNLCTYEMIVTNYNHLISRTEDGMYIIRPDIEELFGRFELVIIDESHIMLKDIFRSDVLIPFMMSLNKIKNTKIILQTATTMFEESVLDIKKTFYIHKPDKIHKKIIFRYDEDFKIQHIMCLVNYYVTNKKKVYIYWNNMSLQNAKRFKTCYHRPDRVVIYHKRNDNDIDMKYVMQEHNIDNFDVIISSVYFGVGNDLLDKLEDVAVIIIGNNPWQEDIQAIGRWRNVKNIECCIVVDKFDKEFIDNTNQQTFSFLDSYNKYKYKYDTILKDLYIKDKSVIINRMAFQIKNQIDCDILSKMQTACDYSSQFKIKCQEFEKRGYDVRKEVKQLEFNDNWETELKKFRLDLKLLRQKTIIDMVNNKFDYDVINNDAKLSRCAHIIKQLKTKDLLQYCDAKTLSLRNIFRYETFLRYYNMNFRDTNDYAELFSILWVKKHMVSGEKNNREININGIVIKYNEYIVICGYLIWLSFRNKEDNEDILSYNYLKKFFEICDDFRHIGQKLIDRIFVQHYYDTKYNDFYKEFLNITNDIYNKKKKEKIVLINKIKRINVDKKYYNKVINFAIKFFEAKTNSHVSGQFGGQIGGQISSPKKKVIITEIFKKPEKYNLNINQEFESCSSLAEFTGKSNTTISQWMKKKWIKAI